MLSEEVVSPSPARPRRRLTTLLGGSVEKFSGIYAIVALFVVFALWVPSTFLTATTWQALIAEQAVITMLAFAILIPLTAGLFDLSPPSVLGLSQILAAWLQGVHHVNPLLSAFLALGASGLVGIVNAIAVIKFRVGSLIATLAMTTILSGVTLGISSYQETISGVSTTYQKFGNVDVLGIPIVAFYMLALGVIIWWFTDRTPQGRFMAAVGGNQEAARLAGIPVKRYLAASLIASSLVAGLAGLIYLAQIGAGSQSAGPPFLLPAFAAVFLGATQVKPGRFNVPGTVVAVLLLAIGIEGLELVGAPLWVSSLFDGVVLILAVALAALRRPSDSPIV